MPDSTVFGGTNLPDEPAFSRAEFAAHVRSQAEEFVRNVLDGVPDSPLVRAITRRVVDGLTERTVLALDSIVKPTPVEYLPSLCSQCGAVFADDPDRAKVGAHIRACPKHPIARLEAGIREALGWLDLPSAHGATSAEVCDEVCRILRRTLNVGGEG